MAEAEEPVTTDLTDCPVCLQTFVNAVQLPCKHIFCFLCVKGVANRSKKCALCRAEIPLNYLFKPVLVKQHEAEAPAFDGEYQWYYEGNRGWWQYDPRTSVDIESHYKDSVENMEMLIAGFLYIVDFKNMVQYRRSDPSRCRRIKRDAVNIPNKKGVAGIVLKPTTVQEASAARLDGDGLDTQVAAAGTAKLTASATSTSVNPVTDTTVIRPPPTGARVDGSQPQSVLLLPDRTAETPQPAAGVGDGRPLPLNPTALPLADAASSAITTPRVQPTATQSKRDPSHAEDVAATRVHASELCETRTPMSTGTTVLTYVTTTPISRSQSNGNSDTSNSEEVNSHTDVDEIRNYVERLNIETRV